MYWTKKLLQGEITFKANGFEIHIRRMPEIMQEQSSGMKESGGISFSTKKEAY